MYYVDGSSIIVTRSGVAYTSSGNSLYFPLEKPFSSSKFNDKSEDSQYKFSYLASDWLAAESPVIPILRYEIRVYGHIF